MLKNASTKKTKQKTPYIRNGQMLPNAFFHTGAGEWGGVFKYIY